MPDRIQAKKKPAGKPRNCARITELMNITNSDVRENCETSDAQNRPKQAFKNKIIAPQGGAFLFAPFENRFELVVIQTEQISRGESHKNRDHSRSLKIH